MSCSLLRLVHLMLKTWLFGSKGCKNFEKSGTTELTWSLWGKTMRPKFDMEATLSWNSLPLPCLGRPSPSLLSVRSIVVASVWTLTTLGNLFESQQLSWPPVSLVERRHSILRKLVQVYMQDLNLTSIDGLRQALAYLLPQMAIQMSLVSCQLMGSWISDWRTKSWTSWWFGYLWADLAGNVLLTMQGWFKIVDFGEPFSGDMPASTVLEPGRIAFTGKMPHICAPHHVRAGFRTVTRFIELWPSRASRQATSHRGSTVTDPMYLTACTTSTTNCGLSEWFPEHCKSGWGWGVHAFKWTSSTHYLKLSLPRMNLQWLKLTHLLRLLHPHLEVNQHRLMRMPSWIPWKMDVVQGTLASLQLPDTIDDGHQLATHWLHQKHPTIFWCSEQLDTFSR